MRDRDDLMEFAVRLAGSAGAITLDHFGSVAVETKGDGSEVTVADRAAEEFVRSSLREAFPDDGIVGEEGEDVPSKSGRRWIVDPIDGTRSFACGVPLYAVLVALEEEGRPTLGCCHFPVLGETLVAARGAGAWHNGRPARVSECDDLAAARMVTSGFEYWRDRSTDEHRAGFDRLVKATRFSRTWGDAYGYLLVAVGRVDLLVDPICGSYWDYAPMIPIFEEAGGRMTTFTGEPLSAWSSVVAANPALHAAASRVLGSG
ncbi:MAG TPA: inositol monophosphatase family protein [Longimicrobiaceae bacterium]|nr:inositol monophosphatase family protein [Longimicrobiaceae bacterium]